MGSFRRRRPESLTGHAGDDQVLASLANVGDLSNPRLWEHFLYCDDEAGADVLEARAREAGWNVEQVDPQYHGIVASRSDRAVTPEAVTEARGFFEGRVAAVAGGEYDGWGAEGD